MEEGRSSRTEGRTGSTRTERKTEGDKIYPALKLKRGEEERTELWYRAVQSRIVQSNVLSLNHDDVSVFEWETNGRSHRMKIMRSRREWSERGGEYILRRPGRMRLLERQLYKKKSKLATTRATQKESVHKYISSDYTNTLSLHSIREGTTTKAVSLNSTYVYFVFFQQSTPRWSNCENWSSTPCLRFSYSTHGVELILTISVHDVFWEKELRRNFMCSTAFANADKIGWIFRDD